MKKLLLAASLCLASFGFINSAAAASVEEERKELQTMTQDVLGDLYKTHPAAKNDINKSYGYAVFSNTGMNLFLLSTARGGGIAFEKASGKKIYMDMFSAGAGIGLGVKEFRGIFIFETKSAFEDFVNNGWDLSGQADAAAKKGDEGEAIDEAMSIAPNVKYYQLTEKGLALQATLQGTKYYKNDKLN
ncbi:hypothetical protein [Motilimonas pumila]|uniref:Ysc84 actin-binding domain-containing protein n=1 Tax=Motilimonas pumila TaxID=2303987 RepID=A0A418YKQ7_9GAMM|nr:hypothetical protein [Motilimonas pumila]RJG51546.1 hypothetical protein D1Z90_02100 [Motilimonas pumila]